MESLSRPLHRRKLSNVNSFSGKNAYDGVFSGHRPKYDGAPAVKVEEYREIFCSNQAGSSIPVLDLSGLEESSDGLESTKPDYGMIFGGFRDQDIAISYEELVARDKVRVQSSISPSSQDLDDLSHESSDNLKLYNMSYNKIFKRNKDGLDVTTHVTQLHDVPGFTCFIDESTSKPNNKTLKQKSSSTNNINVKSSNHDVFVNQTLQSSVEFEFDRHKEESLHDDVNFKTFEADIKSHPFKVLSSSESHVTDNISVSTPADSQLKKEIEKVDLEKTSQIVVESQNGYGQEGHFSDDKNVETFEADLKSCSSNASSSHASSTINLDKHKDNQKKLNDESFSDDKDRNFEANFKSYSSKVSSSKSYAVSTTNLDNHKDHQMRSMATNEEAPSTATIECEPNSDDTNLKTVFEADLNSYSSKISSPAASTTNLDKSKDIKKRSIDESFSFDSNFKTFEADFKSYSSKVSTSHAASATNLNNHKDHDHQKRSTTRNEELDVNSAAAALRKAIEKAQESIRIAKESVGRKKKGISSRSFKNSLKVKARVANVDAIEQQKEKDDNMKVQDHAHVDASEEHKENDDKIKERDHKHVDASEEHKEKDDTMKERDHKIDDGEKLFGDKKVVNETQEEILESVMNSEIPIRSPFELNEKKIFCNSEEVVGRIEAESIESNIFEDTQKDDDRSNGFLVLESCEKNSEDSESNDLTVCQNVETEKKLSQTSDDKDDYVNKFNEESFELLENNMQDNNLEQELDEEIVKDNEGTRSQSEDEKFYDVSDAESIKNSQTYDTNIETKDSSQKEDYEYHKVEESFENSSSDYDDAEENENVIGTSSIVNDTEEVNKVDQNDNNAESSQEINDVSESHAFEVEHKEAVEKEILENISSDECEVKSDNNLETCGFADVDFGTNDVRFESSLDAIHGMEIEVKEYQEKEETVEEQEKEEEEEDDSNFQQPNEETPDAGTPQELKDACRESEPIKVVDEKEEKERERIKLAVERAIREARERAFAEVRQRVLADTQEKVTKSSIDKTSSQSKLRAERALVERATAEARQRALEKAMKISDPRTQVNGDNQTSSTSYTNTESALRSKAKLEKHNRIMERAAKALAEKEKRDLLALREQAERSRLAEYLDADIKRWSSGKEGNLRALLSTLQYILGADSGWKPLSLTEIITTNAVKKAYRKATLCVHPDKVQQRGASIQQKYICEKVFDLLKAAWNRFNSEER